MAGLLVTKAILDWHSLSPPCMEEVVFLLSLTVALEESGPLHQRGCILILNWPSDRYFLTAHDAEPRRNFLLQRSRDARHMGVYPTARQGV